MSAASDAYRYRHYHHWHTSRSLGPVGFAITSAVQDQRYKDQRRFWEYPFRWGIHPTHAPKNARDVFVDWNWRY